jgi:glycosyltransferase involved in cell wall biosynthesis
MAMLLEVRPDRPVILDGLAFGAMPEIGALGPRSPLIALVHQPLATDPALNLGQAKALRSSERAALANATRVVVTSKATARIVKADYRVPSHRISVVQPGTDPAPAALGESNGLIRLLSVGSIVPVKGYDVLIKALAQLKDLSWHLSIAGDRTRHLAFVNQLDADIAATGLTDRVTFLGAVPAARMPELYMSSEMFVLASRFEGFGMALAEAISYGRPVVSTTAGAIPETLPEGSRLLVPPNNSLALARALGYLIGDSSARRRIAHKARLAAVQLPTWQDSTRLFIDAIEMSNTHNFIQ